ncbi:UPF0261 family protein [Jeotgalibacillus sp. S-D1]|uniref:Tm-1-like ATP-binding domain-containing protein n=1 Tax=Jeotgalibacillus sp. S-D1 TaxID=2552189 RepID=UPI0010593AC9|nr:Tm-1-like ATP-binding domain-containing protein [Jeotgalibacillus sp. S-D1]TDL32764.1 UPF0261 family protein [Jeotgalibacillus sp. S-D1]
MKKIMIIGSLDTKEEEFLYVKKVIESASIETILVDTGIYESSVPGDVTNQEVAAEGGFSLQALQEKNDRGEAVTAMATGAGKVVQRFLNEEKLAGIFGMGGTAGTTIAAEAMKAAPVGMPKMIVSTVASGNTRPYVGEKDVTMMYSVVDIAGLNSLSALILQNAANALVGMVKGVNSKNKMQKKKPMIGATMFGVTTPCVTNTRKILEQKGYDVLVFHATGTGGDAMESLINDGFIEGVVDITTTELADQLVGGIFSAGAHRVETAGNKGVPQVVSVGALDMVNFGAPETVPEKFTGRTFYQHNPTTTLMRTTVEENEKLGVILAEKVNKSTGPSIVVFPKGGVSLLDRDGQAFDGIEQRNALYNGIKKNLREDILFVEVEQDINDPTVSTLIAEKLLLLMNKGE